MEFSDLFAIFARCRRQMSRQVPSSARLVDRYNGGILLASRILQDLFFVAALASTKIFYLALQGSNIYFIYLYPFYLKSTLVQPQRADRLKVTE